MSFKEFQLLHKLGEGAYSTVYRVKRLADGNEYALKKVKLMNLSDKEKENAINEVRILASIRHQNIISYKEAFIDANNLCIVMEYADDGDLQQKIVSHQQNHRFASEHDIWKIFTQMVYGLRTLHNLKISHRDLKSANVFMYKNGDVKLGDMNVSKVAKNTMLYTQTGTPYYASPEVWKDQPYDLKSDIWSLGCVLYEMVMLQPPFRADDMDGLYRKICKGFYPKIHVSFSQDLNAVIRALLQVQPSLRPSCEQILQLPFIVNYLSVIQYQLIQDDSSFLLKTIKFPNRAQNISFHLPKSNYSPRQNILQYRHNKLTQATHSHDASTYELELQAEQSKFRNRKDRVNSLNSVQLNQNQSPQNSIKQNLNNIVQIQNQHSGVDLNKIRPMNNAKKLRDNQNYIRLRSEKSTDKHDNYYQLKHNVGSQIESQVPQSKSTSSIKTSIYIQISRNQLKYKYKELKFQPNVSHSNKNKKRLIDQQDLQMQIKTKKRLPMLVARSNNHHQNADQPQKQSDIEKQSLILYLEERREAAQENDRRSRIQSISSPQNLLPQIKHKNQQERKF